MSERRRPPIPDITHLQFLVISLLRPGERSGRHVRAALARHGARRTAPAFYQLMARMEDAGLVAGRYEQKIIESQILKERWYQLTAAGETAWSAARDFYLRAPETALRGDLARA